MNIRIEDRKECIWVASDFWEIEHLKRAGGAWHSIVFKNGSGRNLLSGPMSSGLRVLTAELTGNQESGYFSESNDSVARISIEESAQGAPTVVAEGTYRNADGGAIPVGFRRRTEYSASGAIWTTLQIMSDCGCGNVVEVQALGMPLRAGMTDAYVRFHPTQAGSADLLGGRTWIELSDTAPSRPFVSRFTPLQIACFQRGVEGVELFPASDLAQWDCAFKPDFGLGLFSVAANAGGTAIRLDPYCMTGRRMKTRVQGVTTLKLGITLSAVKPRVEKRRIPHVFLNNPHTTDAQIEQLAAEGVELVCYKDDYREGHEFWRNGAIVPYNAQGMTDLRRVLESCQRCGIKIVPYVSAHELHPETNAYELHAREWMHGAAQSLDIVHAWRGSGELGGLMCLRSGWLEYRKKSIDAILKDLPWDGLCLDWPDPAPCCNPGHAVGPFHSDVENLLELLFFCRERVGTTGTLVFIASNDSSITATNIADHILPRG